ncbi:hypothetical protein MTO96_033264 [Rhipicephalus appendiculatus]
MTSRTATGNVRDTMTVMEIAKVDTVVVTASAPVPAASVLDLLLRREQRHGGTVHEKIKIGQGGKALLKKRLPRRRVKKRRPLAHRVTTYMILLSRPRRTL